MSNTLMYDKLDQALEQMLAPPEGERAACSADIAELLDLASELRDLPRANFKTRLKLELEWEAAGRTVSATADAEGQHDRAAKPALSGNQVLPGPLGKNWAGYPVRRRNFVVSVGLHAAMAFLIGAGFLMVKSATPVIDPQPSVSVRLEPYRAPLGTHPNGGGGSGGAMERLHASAGAAPRSDREQLTPPLLRNNMRSRIVAETSVIAPPDVNVPQSRQVGDPLSALTAPSNGPGVGGGMGGNAGGGVGGEGGFGRGPGSGGGCCGGLYTVGNGVSMPRAIYSPEPEFSEEARRVKHQGEVTLLATIGADGVPRNLIVVRSLGMGLDEKALEAVRTWRFEPAKKNGRPVAVQMNVIVNFRLF
ncbi:MAG: energy transducer TonB [Candidatus Angelobacter sp.]